MVDTPLLYYLDWESIDQVESDDDNEPIPGLEPSAVVAAPLPPSGRPNRPERPPTSIDRLPFPRNRATIRPTSRSIHFWVS
jgi:hypothetical protein